VGKHGARCLFCLIGWAVAWSAPAEAQRARALSDEVGPVELTLSEDAFRVGGVTMGDAVRYLRGHAAFPICFEFVERDGVADAVTLRQVLGEYGLLKAHGLRPEQQQRMEIYERMSREKGLGESVGIRQKVFRLSAHRIRLRALLERLVELDDEYVWRDVGKADAPLIVIEPRRRSALAWAVPALCDVAPSSTRRLFAPGGTLTQQFAAHDVTQVLGSSSGQELPDVPVDLCLPGLTARDALDLAVVKSGPRWSWMLSGIKGLRWLMFSEEPAP
jgi:hypothetical protein